MSMSDSAQNIAVCNQSLGLLGAKAITVGATGGVNYKYCVIVFDDARDEILTAHKWNFAKKRAYAIQTTKPLFGPGKAFTPPSDYLKIWQVEEEPDTKFEVENALIITDEGETPVAYDDDEVDYLVGQYLTSDFSDDDLTYLVDTAFTSSDEEGDLEDNCTSQGADLEVLKVEYIYQHTTFSTWPVYATQCLVINLARMLVTALKQKPEAAFNLQQMLYGGPKITGYLDIARSIDAMEGGAVAIKTSTWLKARR